MGRPRRKLREWLHLPPPPDDRELCVRCGKPVAPGQGVLPTGGRALPPRNVHPECHAAAYRFLEDI